MSKLLSSVCALCLLSACSGVPVFAPQEILTAYQPNELAASAAKMPVGVTVRGRPFGMDDQAMAQRVAALLPTSTPAAGRIAAASGPMDKPIHHLVFNFAAPANESADELCRGGRAGVPPAPSGGDRVKVFGALCIGVSPLTWAVGSTDGASTPDAPAFQALINRMGSILMPSDNPGNKGESNVRMN